MKSSQADEIVCLRQGAKSNPVIDSGFGSSTSLSATSLELFQLHVRSFETMVDIL